jgi:hypothetical protein
MIATLLCPDRLTLTNVICTSGGQHQDWSADYRLYSRQRVTSETLFDPVISALEDRLPVGSPLVVAMDDTIIRKTGTKIAGVTWKRDPLGPAFQTNLIRAQRFLQFSAAWPLSLEKEPSSSPSDHATSPPSPSLNGSMLSTLPAGAARMVPIAFHYAPGAPKLTLKEKEDKAAVSENKKRRKELSLTAQTVKKMKELREKVPALRTIHHIGDGSFTNGPTIKQLPANTFYTGRSRKDLVLNYLPEEPTPGAKGRRQSYGALAPTPEALREDENVPWQEITAYAAGRFHTFNIKVLDKVLWRKTGAKQQLKVIVIRPLGYRLKKGSKVLYRQAAYLLSTATEMAVAEILQAYLWRWGIEVNFREEKSLIGTGEAQVRGVAANEQLPAMTVAAYSHLWLAALELRDRGEDLAVLNPPKWRPQAEPDANTLPSTGDLLRLLRYDYWASALRPGHFYHFKNGQPRAKKSEKCPPDLAATLLAAA